MTDVFTNPSLQHWLILSALLFSLGIYGFLTRRNVIAILISVELMLNATALNFAVFNHYRTPSEVDGQIFVLFIIAIAASEVVVALAIFISLYKHLKTTDINKMNLLHG